MRRKLIIGGIAFCMVLGGCKVYEGQMGKQVRNGVKTFQVSEKEGKELENEIRKELSIGEEYKLIKSGTEKGRYDSDYCLTFEHIDKTMRVHYSLANESVVGMELNIRNSEKIIKYTKEELQSKVEEIIDTNFKDKKGQLKQINKEEAVKDTSYRFEFIRTIDGEEYSEDGITIYISGVTGELAGYYIKWSDVTYKKNTSIDEDEARNIFISQDEIEAKYERVDISKIEAEPIYKLIPIYTINAKNSGVLDANKKKFIEGKEMESYRDYNNYNEGFFYRYGEKTNQKSKISEDEASKTLKTAIKSLGIKESWKVRGSRLLMDNSSETLYWNIELGFNGAAITGDVDAENGRLLGISAQMEFLGKYDSLKDLKQQYDNGYITKEMFEESAKAQLDNGDISKVQFDSRWDEDPNFIKENEVEVKIKEYFKKLTGTDTELKFKENDNENIKVFMGFRVENGIPYYKNIIKTMYNKGTHKLVSIELNWDYDLKFEKAQNMLSKEKAVEKIYDKIGIERKLIRKLDDKTKKPSKELTLVYALGNQQRLSMSLDGKEFYNANGKYEKEESRLKIKDIDKAKNSREIEMVYSMGIVDAPENMFRPSEKLTKSDAIRWIVRAMNDKKYEYLNYETIYNGEQSGFDDIAKDDDEFYMVLDAVELDILEEGGNFNSTGMVSRNDMAKWIINALGEKALAQNQKLFGNEGYKKLGEFYGIINSNDSEENLIREEGAKIIYDFLSLIEGNKK